MPQEDNRTHFQTLIDEVRNTRESIDMVWDSLHDIGDKIVSSLSSLTAVVQHQHSFAAPLEPTPPAMAAQAPQTSVGNIDLKSIFSSGPGADIASFMNTRKFTQLQGELLKSIKTSLSSAKFEFDSINVADIIGEKDKASALPFSRFNRIRSELLKSIESAIPEKIELGDSPSVGDILGETKEQGMFFKLRLEKLRHDLLGLISKAAKEGVATKDDLDKSFSTEESTLDSPQSSSSLETIVEEGFETSNTWLEKIASFLQGDELSDREEAKKKRMKYERLFGDKKGVTAPSEDKGFIEKVGGGFGKGIAGLFTGISVGLLKLSFPKLLIGVGVLAALGGVLALHAFAFKQFADDINWKNVFIGIGAITALGIAAAALGFVSKFMLLGALGIGALGLALLPFAAALRIAGPELHHFTKMFDTSMETLVDIIRIVVPEIREIVSVIINAIVSLVDTIARVITSTLSTIEGIISSIGESISKTVKYIFGGVSDVITSIGEAISGTIDSVFGGISSVVDAVSNAITRIIENIIRLGDLDANEVKEVAASISSLGLAVAGFGAGTGLGSLLSFFAKDPVEKFERFAEAGPGLSLTSSAIQSLGDAIASFDSTAVEVMGSSLSSLAHSLESFARSGWRGRNNPLEPLNEIAELLPKLNFGQVNFSFGDSLQNFLTLLDRKNAISVLADNIHLVAGALSAVSQALSLIDHSHVRILLSPEQSTVELTPITRAIAAEDLLQQIMLNTELREMSESDRMSGSMASVISNQNVGPTNRSVSNISYNVANHIDDTLQNIVYINRF